MAGLSLQFLLGPNIMSVRRKAPIEKEIHRDRVAQRLSTESREIMNIGTASRASGVSQRMIRHYEKIGLIAPAPRRGSGYRDYSGTDVHKLSFIANARDIGFAIEEIRGLLGLWADRNRSKSEVKALAVARAEELGRKAAKLETMRHALQQLIGQCHGDDDLGDCPILAGISSGGNKAEISCGSECNLSDLADELPNDRLIGQDRTDGVQTRISPAAPA